MKTCYMETHQPLHNHGPNPKVKDKTPRMSQQKDDENTWVLDAFFSAPGFLSKYINFLII